MLTSALLDAWRGHEMPRVPGFANTGGAWGHMGVRTIPQLQWDQQKSIEPVGSYSCDVP